MLDAVEQDMLAEDVGEPAILRAVDLYLQGEMDSEQSARDVSKELAILDREMERLTSLAASGAGEIPAVLEASGREKNADGSLMA